MRRVVCLVVVGIALFSASPVWAQDPPPEPKIWSVTASVGLALTSGNKDSSTVNASYEVVYNPQSRNVVKSDALWIRGKIEDDLSTDRLGINIRDEYTLSNRMYVFGQNQYLRDRVKDIDYLFAPAGGFGYKLIESTATMLGLDVGAGGVWEKNRGFDSVTSSGALTLNQKLTQTLTATTSLTQSFSGLWRMNNLDDSLYTLNVGVSASMSTRTQLKVELLDTFKSLPPVPAIKRNDVAVLVALVYKI